MKVLFIARATLYESPGGDTVQLLKTAEALQQFNINITIGLTNETFNYETYDIVHFFNIIRPADILSHFKKSRVRVISTIFVDYTEAEIRSGSKIRAWLTKLLGSHAIEYLKTFAKAVLGKEKVQDISYFWLGQYRAIRFLYRNADALLPNSDSEWQRLQKTYGKTAAICQKVVNAIEILPDIQPDDTFCNAIICVGRIERRKNQLQLIKAVNGLDIPCYIIGKPAINDLEYYYACKKEGAAHVYFIDNLPQAEVYAIMKAAKVHVLPSWFETTGLVSLEAAYYGCNIVISDKGDQKEYFGENAFYCNPGDVASIQQAIVKAYKAPFNEKFKEHIAKHYQWSETAKQTRQVYKDLLRKL